MDSEVIKLTYWVGGIVISIISYFLKKIHEKMIGTEKDVTDLNEKLSSLKSQIDVNQVATNLKIESLNEKYQAIMKLLVEINQDIKNINSKLK